MAKSSQKKPLTFFLAGERELRARHREMGKDKVLDGRRRSDRLCERPN
jgi:hypothetical protein